MVVLKKLNLDYRVKASTLLETLVASVLIVVVFMISSMILNNLFSNTVKNNTRQVDAHLNELQYLYQNDKLQLPYADDFEQWTISIEQATEFSKSFIVFEAINLETKKHIERELYESH